jgi:hypothetical protein
MVPEDDPGLEPGGLEGTEDEPPSRSESDWPHLSEIDLDVCLAPTSLSGSPPIAEQDE